MMIEKKIMTAETERVIMAVEKEDEGDREDENDDGRERERR